MGYNGSGTWVYATSGIPVVTSTTISSTVQNNVLTEQGTGFSTAICKDGQTATTARIPFIFGINSSLTTDSTSTGTGSIITAGGIGITKALWVGTTAMVAGSVIYLGGTTSSELSLRRSGTSLLVRTGDDSAYVQVNAAQYITFSSLIYMGGTTSSEVSLRRSGANMLARLGDDSNYCNFLAAQITAASDVLYFGGALVTTALIKRSSTTLLIRKGDDSADAGITCGNLTTTGTVNLNGTSGTFLNSVIVTNGVVTGGT